MKVEHHKKLWSVVSFWNGEVEVREFFYVHAARGFGRATAAEMTSHRRMIAAFAAAVEKALALPRPAGMRLVGVGGIPSSFPMATRSRMSETGRFLNVRIGKFLAKFSKTNKCSHNNLWQSA